MEFKEFGFEKEIQRALDDLEHDIPTQIQKEAIPKILEGKDILGMAQTGTGKTAAFSLPLLQLLIQNKIKSKPNTPKVLILAPTRELVAQIGENIDSYSKHTKISSLAIYGGVKHELQISKLNRGVEILVATPGRLNDLVKQKKISLEEVSYLVLDEVDRMLDMGFSKDLDDIFPILPKKKQSLFFSATLTDKTQIYSLEILKDPIVIKLESSQSLVSKMTQEVFFVDPEKKDEVLLRLVRDNKLKSVLIFCATRRGADDIVRLFTKNDISSIAIHSNKSQTHRNKALNKFKNGDVKILIATDIASRGLHIENISHIINYDIPNKPEIYIHRVGRTARAGARGIAYSLCTNYEREYLRDIEKLTNKPINVRVHELHSNRASKAKGEKAKPKFVKQGSGFLKKVKKKDKPKKSGRQY